MKFFSLKMSLLMGAVSILTLFMITLLDFSLKSNLITAVIRNMIFLFLALLSMYILLNKYLLKPINEIVQKVRKATEGDLTVIIPNDNLANCWEVQKCDKTACSAYNNENKRCWQIQGTFCRGEVQGDLMSKVKFCEKCEVYKRASNQATKVISEAVNNLIEVQRQIITSINIGSENVARASNDLSVISEKIAENGQSQSASSQETLSSMEELDASIQHISSNAQEVSLNISNVRKLVGNIVEISNNVSGSVDHVNVLTANTINVTKDGRDAVEKSQEGMNKISSAVGNLDNVIKNLGSSAADIGEIVDVIDDIAEQTNLLALNAAIEAARAGEQGKGFAVVAGAIRNLAEKSGEATKEIAKLVRGIQEAVSQAVETARQGSSNVQDGVSLAELTRKSLNKIEEAINNTAEEVKIMSVLTEQQGKAIKDIVKSSEDVDASAQTIAATVEEQTASSSEVVKAVEEVSLSANKIAVSTDNIVNATMSLSNEAQKLREMVLKFKIN